MELRLDEGNISVAASCFSKMEATVSLSKVYSGRPLIDEALAVPSEMSATGRYCPSGSLSRARAKLNESMPEASTTTRLRPLSPVVSI